MDIISGCALAKRVIHVQQLEYFFVVISLIHAQVEIEADQVGFFVDYCVAICTCHNRLVALTVLKCKLRHRLQWISLDYLRQAIVVSVRQLSVTSQHVRAHLEAILHVLQE